MGDSIHYCDDCETNVGCHLARKCLAAKEPLPNGYERRLEAFCASDGCSWAGDHDETTSSLKDELTGQIVECSGDDPRGERCCPRCLLANLVDTEGWDDDQLPKRAFRQA